MYEKRAKYTARQSRTTSRRPNCGRKGNIVSYVGRNAKRCEAEACLVAGWFFLSPGYWVCIPCKTTLSFSLLLQTPEPPALTRVFSTCVLAEGGKPGKTDSAPPPSIASLCRPRCCLALVCGSGVESAADVQGAPHGETRTSTRRSRRIELLVGRISFTCIFTHSIVSLLYHIVFMLQARD